MYRICFFFVLLLTQLPSIAVNFPDVSSSHKILSDLDRTIASTCHNCETYIGDTLTCNEPKHGICSNCVDAGVNCHECPMQPSENEENPQAKKRLKSSIDHIKFQCNECQWQGLYQDKTCHERLCKNLQVEGIGFSTPKRPRKRKINKKEENLGLIQKFRRYNLHPDTPPPLSKPNHQINIEYIKGLLHKSEAQHNTHKTELLTKLSADINDGKVDIGSRQPYKNTPLWITPKVLKGGFATNEYLAGGDLTPFEKSIWDKIGSETPNASPEQIRSGINQYFLTNDEGMNTLLDAINTKKYKITCAEEAAIPSILILNEKNSAAATDILTQIAPYLTKLRFFPEIIDDPVTEASHSFSMSSAGAVLDKLEDRHYCITKKDQEKITPPPQKKQLMEDIEKINKKNRGALNFLDSTRKWSSTPNANTIAPDKISSSNRCLYIHQLEEAITNLKDIPELNEEQKKNKLAKKRSGMNGFLIAFLKGYLKYLKEEIHIQPSALHNSRSKIEGFLNAIEKKNQNISSPPNNSTSPSNHSKYKEILNSAIGKLRTMPREASLHKDIVEEEFFSGLSSLPPKMERSFRRKLKPLIQFDLDEHINEGTLSSLEQVGEISHELLDSIRWKYLGDTSIGALYINTKKAFSKRRSLLLLNLENQIKAEEVPWINELKQAIPVPISNLDPMYIISGTESLVNFAQNKFPQTSLPNKFVSALYDINKEADLTYPLTKELAFDIFQGQFSKSFVDSAQEAASIMPNTIYARYYGLDYKKLRDKLKLDSDFDHSKYKKIKSHLSDEFIIKNLISDQSIYRKLFLERKNNRNYENQDEYNYTANKLRNFSQKVENDMATIFPDTPISIVFNLLSKLSLAKIETKDDFEKELDNIYLGLCLIKECSANVPKTDRHTARNACILENQQIITTHNLASNMINLGLQKKTEDKGGQMAVDCANSIVADVKSLQKIQQGIDMNNHSYKIKLHKIIAIGKAWRQMLFYLSFSKRNRDQELIKILRQIPEKIVSENKKSSATQAINDLEHLLSLADDPESTENKKKFTPNNPILGSTLDGSKFPF